MIGLTGSALPLQSGLIIPPLPHTISLIIGTIIVLVLLVATRPPVTERTILALVPWIMSGGILHVFWALGERFGVRIYPVQFEPVFSAPAVYFATFIAMGLMWVVSVMIVPTEKLRKQVPQYLGATGIGVLIPLVALVIWQGLDPQVAPMRPIEPVFGLVLALVLTGVVYFAIGTWRTYIIARARYVGALVIFAHLFDSVTTAVGWDLLGSEERSMIPKLILEFGDSLPTASVIGSGWLFVLFKLFAASAIVVYFADDMNEYETQTNLLFGFVAALGLGPGTYNFFLFVLDIA